MTMKQDRRQQATDGEESGEARHALPDAARRALAEAAERRARHEADAAHEDGRPKEINGREGPEPIRYGDWEKNGIISDF